MKPKLPKKGAVARLRKRFEERKAQVTASDELVLTLNNGPIISENITIDQHYRFTKEINRLRSALDFYADPETYAPRPDNSMYYGEYSSLISYDQGKTAKEALEGQKS